MPQAVLASRLSDGRVVFAAREGAGVTWVALLAEAAVAEDGTEAEGLLALAEANASASNEVIDAYLIDLAQDGDGWRPSKYREWIRAAGPTIRADLGKQAEGAKA